MTRTKDLYGTAGAVPFQGDQSSWLPPTVPEHTARSDTQRSRCRLVERSPEAMANAREQLLLLLKLLTMNTAATATQLHGVLEVQHLVIHDVLNGTAGHERMV